MTQAEHKIALDPRSAVRPQADPPTDRPAESPPPGGPAGQAVAEQAPASASPGRLRADVVGVDLLSDGRAVAVGLNRSPGGRVRSAFVHVAESAGQLSGLLKSRRISAGRINVLLPRHKFISKTFKLPTTEPEELRSMLDFELAGLIPFSEGRNARAYLTGPADEPGYTEIAAFVTPDHVIEDYVGPLRQGGVEPDRIVAGPVAMLAWSRVCQGLDARHDGSLLMLAADDWSLDAVTLRGGGRLGFCRSVALGVAGGGSELIDEAVKSVSQARSQLGEPPRQVLLIGPQAQADTLRLELDRRGAIEPAPGEQRIDWAGGLGQINGKSDDSPHRSGPLAAAVARAAGAAAIEFVGELAGFNLLPQSITGLREQVRFKRNVLVTGVLGLLLLGLTGGVIVQSNLRAQRRVDRLEQAIAPIKKTALELDEKQKQLALLKTQLEGRTRPLATLSELYRIAPKGLTVVELDLTGEQLTLVGQAETPDLAYRFTTLLMKSPQFDHVSFQGAYPVNKPGGVVTEFTVTAHVSDVAPGTAPPAGQK